MAWTCLLHQGYSLTHQLVLTQPLAGAREQHAQLTQLPMHHQ